MSRTSHAAGAPGGDAAYIGLGKRLKPDLATCGTGMDFALHF